MVIMMTTDNQDFRWEGEPSVSGFGRLNGRGLERGREKLF